MAFLHIICIVPFRFCPYNLVSMTRILVEVTFVTEMNSPLPCHVLSPFYKAPLESSFRLVLVDLTLLTGAVFVKPSVIKVTLDCSSRRSIPGEWWISRKREELLIGSEFLPRASSFVIAAS